ncbi:MAG: CHASE2 domain-containing protein [Nibricoccus sp.]
MLRPKSLKSLRWLALLPIPALWWLAHVFGWISFLEQRSIDWRFRFRGEIDAPVKIAYVDVDSKSISDIGNQPWDRAYYAEVCAALIAAGQVKAIGVDYVFSENGKPELVDEPRFLQGTAELRQLLNSTPPIPVVVAAAYAAADDRDINGMRIIRELPEADMPPDQVEPPEKPTFRINAAELHHPPVMGLIDTIDGGTRKVPLFARTKDGTFFHMGVELARLYWGLPRDAVKIGREKLDFAQEDGVVRASIPLLSHRDLEVNWFSRWDSPERNPRVSFSLVLIASRMRTSTDPDERASATEFFSRFRDAVVLIGPVDPLLQDIAPTPLDVRPVPRVGIHGNLLKTIVSGKYLHRLSPLLTLAIILVLTSAACGLVLASGRRSTLRKVGAVVLLVAYTYLAFVVFARSHWVLPIITPLGAAFTTSFAALIWQLIVEEKQRGRIKGMFGTYVSPELVNRMIESGEEPRLGGVEARITAYFSDIEGFSSFSEKLPPDQLVELMNEYLTACTDIVTAQGGTLDKYIGDAVVAMFGAPVEFADHAYRACVASQLVQERLDALRKKWMSAGSKWPATVGHMHTRIGLNSGAAVVGNMGSLTRFNYTMMGDTVNIASRLETGARSYGAGTLVTEATKIAAELAGDRCVFRFLDRIVVKGRSQPVPIFEILGLKESISPSTRECAQHFAEGMDLYLRQEWDRAIAAFERSAKLEPRQPDEFTEINPSLLYLKRCELMKQHPPTQNWNGVFVMTTK